MCKTAIFSTSNDKLVDSILSCEYNKVKTKVIITNKPDSPVFEVAKKHNIKCKCFDHRDYEDRISHEYAIISFLRQEGIKLVVFAHYMRLVTKFFVDHFINRIINIHPSLLPAFKGANSYKDAFNAGVNKSGCTIHYVDEGLDTGEVILQKEVPCFETDTFESFRERVEDVECEAIRSVLQSVAV